MDLTRASDFWEKFILLAQVRWQLFQNVLRRNTQKKLELAFRILAWLMLAGVSIMVGLVMFGAVYGLLPKSPTVLIVALWFVLLGWQLIPILFETFAPNLDFSEIARYPVSFPLFYTLHLAYGVLEPAAIAAMFWLAMIWLAVVLHHPAQGLRAFVLFPLFAIFCLLLNRVVMGWIQRVLSSRRGRIVISVLLALLALSSQFLVYGISPDGMRRHLAAFASIWKALTRYSPPGVTGQGVSAGGVWSWAAAVTLSGGVFLLAILLRRQLRRVYAGENRSESKQRQGPVKVQPGWKIPFIGSQLSAIAEKEIRYLLRNPMQLINVVTIWGFILIFAFSSDFARRAFGVSASARALYFYPAAVYYSMFSLTNPAFNCFGADPPGFQRWFLLPLDKKNVLRGKNLGLLVLCAVNWLVVTVIVSAFFPVTPIDMVGMLLAAVYILLGYITVGNLLSVWFPKKLREHRWQAKNASEAAVIIGMVLFLLLAASSGAIVYAQRALAVSWLLPVALGSLCLVLWLVYCFTLDVAARKLEDQREKVLQELG